MERSSVGLCHYTTYSYINQFIYDIKIPNGARAARAHGVLIVKKLNKMYSKDLVSNLPRKRTPWNSNRPTPDCAVHRPDGTTNITSLHRTLKKKFLIYFGQTTSCPAWYH